jgi:hypothetical protein
VTTSPAWRPIRSFVGAIVPLALIASTSARIASAASTPF